MTVTGVMPKADPGDYLGRFRDIISDPLNLLIERVPQAGYVDNGNVFLHNGLRVPVYGPASYYGPFSQILITNRGVHEPLEEYVFQEVLRRMPEAPSMIELGAYWGHYSMWLKKTRPNGRVILVEPELAHLKVGEQNFTQNGFHGEFIQAFVANGKFEIDAFLRERRIQHLNILHSDIQGYEIELLDHARETLRRHAAHNLFISTHSQEIHRIIVERLQVDGYRVEVSSDFDNQTTAQDGFIFASSPTIEPVFEAFEVFGRDKINQANPAEMVRSLQQSPFPIESGRTQRINSLT